MLFTPTALQGAWTITPERLADERGFFARTYCRREFEAHGLSTEFVQFSVSHNVVKGTLRGMHYQADPHAETKLVRCTRGAIFDVIVDLRPGSTSYEQWFSVELNVENRKALYVPEGVAHGFQSLQDDTEVVYQVSEFYDPELARGVRWNDPRLGIEWPCSEPVLSDRDRALPLWHRPQRSDPRSTS